MMTTAVNNSYQSVSSIVTMSYVESPAFDSLMTGRREVDGPVRAARYKTGRPPEIWRDSAAFRAMRIFE
jgi:hypothetical protein